MPELPEVETVRRGLAPVMEGQLIARVDVNRPDLRWPFPERMAARLTGTRVMVLRRRSKYLLADLNSGDTLLVHLGMSGRMQISGHPSALFVYDHPQAMRHDHVVLHLESGVRITFNDPRRFGAMDLIPTSRVSHHRLLRNLGPEPLSNNFHADYLAGIFKGRRTNVKAALLNQKLIAGLGNIYVCEALYRARISPKRAAGRIGRERIEALVSAIRSVLQEAIISGGSSLRDHRTASGELGYFQHNFDVYGREGEPCHTPGCGGVIKRIVQSGRSTFYCPQCQR